MTFTEEENVSSCLIYPGPVHLFLSFGMFHAVELAKTYKVTVLLEDDAITQVPPGILKAITDRGISFVTIERKRLLKKHIVYRNQSRRLFSGHFDFLLIDNDMGELNVYLARQAKRRECPVICYQTGAALGDIRNDYLHALEVLGMRWAQKRKLPRAVGRVLARAELRARHIWQYWLAPVLVGEAPFRGRSSIYLRTARSGHRDGNNVLVFERYLYDAYVNEGVGPEQVKLVGHPLAGSLGRAFFEECYPDSVGEKIVLVLVDWPVMDAEQGDDVAATLLKNTVRLVKHVLACIQDIPVLIKPHPVMFYDPGFVAQLSAMLNNIPRVRVVESEINALTLLVSASVVVGERSTVLDVARNLGGPCVVSVGIAGSLPDGPFRNNDGIHCFPDIESILAEDLSGLERMPLPASNVLPTVTETIRQL